MADSPSTTQGTSLLKFAVLAAVSGYLIYDMATATEAPSTTLKVLQYFVLACSLFALVGMAVQFMAAKK